MCVFECVGRLPAAKGRRAFRNPKLIHFILMFIFFVVVYFTALFPRTLFAHLMTASITGQYDIYSINISLNEFCHR